MATEVQMRQKCYPLYSSSVIVALLKAIVVQIRGRQGICGLMDAVADGRVWGGHIQSRLVSDGQAEHLANFIGQQLVCAHEFRAIDKDLERRLTLALAEQAGREPTPDLPRQVFADLFGREPW